MNSTAPALMPLATANNEPAFALPARLLVLSVVLTACVIGAGWFGVMFLLAQPVEARWSGVVGVAVVLVVNLVGVLVMMPWRVRPVSMWMTWWLGVTGFRLLMTPLVLFLLYSAAPQALEVKPLVLSVALTYLVTVLAEAGALASHVRRSLPSR